MLNVTGVQTCALPIWLEDGQIINMKRGLMGVNAKAIYSFEERVNHIVLDRKANSFLWNFQNGLYFFQIVFKMYNFHLDMKHTLLMITPYFPHCFRAASNESSKDEEVL